MSVVKVDFFDGLIDSLPILSHLAVMHMVVQKIVQNKLIILMLPCILAEWILAQKYTLQVDKAKSSHNVSSRLSMDTGNRWTSYRALCSWSKLLQQKRRRGENCGQKAREGKGREEEGREEERERWGGGGGLVYVIVVCKFVT